MSDVVLQAIGLRKSYTQGQSRLEVLKGVDFKVNAGERVAVVGRSGSGKSTLLHVLAGLDDADEGTVLVGEEDLSAATPAERAKIRNASMGFVYQFHHLLPEFSALENVVMPLRLGGVRVTVAEKQARELLVAVGMEQRLAHRPSALSGGERQRVAVARALIGEPLVVLADEPTGNLDWENAEQVFELMCRLNEERGVSFVIVTHDKTTLDGMHRVLELNDGAIR
ncbi:MAG: ATP-binding cassette domain-containing protein [Proteobacteria bacterium]|nr:ATP-binding cassette domain-containing protein [Pseudomonadota bacterium]TDJ31329.1 MAG: ATP-binding cassette domain-containing protein [Gammaproteobacteria bacterium]